MGKKYYDPSCHGPFEKIGLSRRMCMLSGGYIMCPGLTDELECKVFNSKTKTEEVSMFGLLGERKPVDVPARCEECLKANPGITLQVVKPK